MPVFISPNQYCAYNLGMELYGQKVIYQRLDGTTHIFNLLLDGTEYEVEDDNILESNLEDALDDLAADSTKWLFIESEECQQVEIRNAGGWIPWNGSSSGSASGSGSGSGSESNNSRSTISTLPFKRKKVEVSRKSKRKLRKSRKSRKLRKSA